MKKLNFNLKLGSLRKTPKKKVIFGVFMLLLIATPMFANGGAGALSNAAGTIRDYLPGIKNLVKAIAVIVAIVGGIRIFNKWQNGDQDVTKEIIGWVGAIIFILLVPTFVEAVFPAA